MKSPPKHAAGLPSKKTQWPEYVGAAPVPSSPKDKPKLPPREGFSPQWGPKSRDGDAPLVIDKGELSQLRASKCFLTRALSAPCAAVAVFLYERAHC